ncbi:hypothetical protein B0H17DRAFT_1095259 [Mycena rosella]|uniref:Uncharacterized protein n=1 Tax=Mycena rosella TaxID=1033263 RepID=A0AAD7CRG6_MYCRO|nr:hypothetical protein B0H17DRAFT_1095259 [Mycena rosella]
MHKFWMPSSLLATIARLPTCTPNLEAVSVLVEAGFKAEDAGQNQEIDAALKSLPRLREVHFGVGRRVGFDFESATRQRLPLVSDAGLLRFSTMDSGGSTHPLAVFSN